MEAVNQVPLLFSFNGIPLVIGNFKPIPLDSGVKPTAMDLRLANQRKARKNAHK